MDELSGEKLNVWVEFSGDNPCALIDYAHEDVSLKRIPSPHYIAPDVRALKRLADCLAVPAILAFYDDNKTSFKVVPLNALAFNYLPEPEILSAQDMQSLTARIRADLEHYEQEADDLPY